MTDLVRFNLPAEFILSRVLLTGAEIALGLEKEWLRPQDAVAIALTKLTSGMTLSEVEEQLALLLPEDYDSATALTTRLAVSDEPLEERQRVWLYLILDWLLHNEHEVEDAYTFIELLYADFGHPEEIRGLVRYMPPPSEEREMSINERWRRYLERERTRYRSRNEELLP